MLNLMVIRSLRSAKSVKSVKPNGKWKPKKFTKVLTLIRWKMWKVLNCLLKKWKGVR